MKKWYLILSWTIRVLVFFAFSFAGLGKISSDEAVLEMFSNWGFPDGFYFVIGLLEILLAIGLLIPKTFKIALTGLTVLMFGAITTHIINDPLSQTLRPIIFLGFLFGIYILNFRKGKTA